MRHRRYPASVIRQQARLRAYKGVNPTPKQLRKFKESEATGLLMLAHNRRLR